MFAPFRNIKRKIKASICLLACIFMLTTTFVAISKTSNALEVVSPSIPPEAEVLNPAPITSLTPVISFPCVAPFSLGTEIGLLSTATGNAILSAQNQIINNVVYNDIKNMEYGIVAKILDETKALTDFFIELWVKMLHSYFRQMTSNFAVLEANQERMIGSLIDVAEQNKAARNIGKTEAEVSRAMRPSDSLKVVATVIGGLERAKTIQKGYTLASAAALLNRTAANQNAQSLTGTGEEQSFSGGVIADFAGRWERYVEKYCDSTANAGYAGCEEDGLFKGLDVNVSDAVFSRETIEFADADIAEAVNELVMNFAEPFIPDPLPVGLSGSTEGRMTIIDTEAYKSKRQVVLDAINHIVSRRLPGSQMGTYMGQLRSDAGINIESLSSLAPYNPSYNEVMHYMTSERFRTGKFAIEQIDEPENNLREKVVQNAFFLMQLNDMNDLLDKQAMIVTARVSENVKEYVFSDNAGVGSLATGGGN